MKKTYLYAAISILLWSTMATVSKLLLGSLNSYQVLMCNALFAAVALLIPAIFSGKIKQLTKYQLKDYLLTLLIGLPGTFLYYVFLYTGTERMAASQAFIINYLWPIMSVVFACIILGERLTARKWIALALSFLGVLTVAGNELLHFQVGTLLGVLLCIGAAVSYGLFTALNRKWDYDDQITIMLSFFASFVLTLIINLFMGEEFHIGAIQVMGFAWNGMAVMGFASLLWALALKKGGTSKIANLAYITPFLSLVWTFWILKEPISPYSIIGLCLIVVGILIQLKPPKKEKENSHHE
ncbi:MAG: DMT family transporter [Clostridia bacterium]|nr:DMT family transporter [Clostridia bacterium]